MTLLTKIRQNHGYTQRALAKKLEVSKLSIINWESRRYKPGPHAVRAIRLFIEDVTGSPEKANQVIEDLLEGEKG